ncbi:DEAD/DEAH box helicase family protein, partial [Lactobacillus jensenii]|uniref:DEAD/DEAH box helicase family protein n=1 Tax=Lactobacillus jensenii TaxID=109790 RepID=UPI00287088D5
AKYLFATIQTLSQEDLLKSLAPAEFDFVLIDEAHRTAAPSYHRVLNHLEPKFLLGMTATPERMDNENVFEIFDYNLAYE